MRKKLATRFAITFTLGLYLIFIGGASITLAQDQPDGSTIISPQTTNGTWGPGTLTANTDVVINAGVVITIAPGTTIQVRDGVGFTVNGELHSTGPVTFTTASIPALPGAWAGVTYAPNSSGTLDQTTIEFAQHALTLNTSNPITVTNSTLRYNRHQTSGSNMAYGAGLYIQQGDHLIQNTHVHDNQATATGSGEVRGAGVYIVDGAPRILESWIYENTATSGYPVSGGGIGVAGGAALIQYSHILTNTVTGDNVSPLKSGGGIGILGDTDTVIRDSWIMANESVPPNGNAGGGGIGFGSNARALLIDGNVIAYNSVSTSYWGEGGGIDAWSSNAFTATNNLIYDNTSSHTSGGININANIDAGNINVFNNTIVGNTANWGGGLRRQTNGRVFNNIIVGNTANTTGGGVYGSSGDAGYNDVWDNTPNNYNESAPATDVQFDPLFVGTGDLVQRYQLRQGSLLIDAGTNSVSGLPDDDYDGTQRPIGASWDIGFDEVDPFVATKVVDLETASPAMALVYTIVITNPDPHSMIIDGQIEDVVPPNITYSEGPGCNLGTCDYDGVNTITWDGNVPGESALILTYTVQVNLGLSDGTEINNQAEVNGELTNRVTTTIYNPDLAVTKSAAPEPVEAGQRLDYTIVIENSGLGAATGVTVSDPLPDDTQFIPGSIAIDPPAAGTPGTAPPTLTSDVRVNAGERVTVTFAVTVDQPLDAGALITNTASVTSIQNATPIGSEVESTVSTTPAVSVVKDGPDTAQIDETLVYTFTVTNVSNTLLHNVQVVDNYAGTATLVAGDDGDGWLDLSEAWVYTASYTVQAGDPDPLVNTVTVTATDALDTATDAQDTHSTDINYTPMLDVVKEGPDAAGLGETVVYTFSITHDTSNGDGSPVQILTVTDDVAGDATYLSGDDDDDSWLQADETWTYTVAHTVQLADPNPLINQVTATGTDLDGDTVIATDTHSTTINYTPALTVVKDGPDIAEVDETVVYTFSITHDTINGDGSPVKILAVTDDVAGEATYVSGDDGDDWLQASETWVYTASYTIAPDDPNPLENEVSVSAEDRDGDQVSASDSHSTFLSTSGLSLVKDGPVSASVRERVIFTFTVAHADGGSSLPVHEVQVNDNIAGDATYVSGDLDQNDWLDAGEAWIYTATYTIQPNAPAILKNTGTVTARDGNDALIVASDTHTTTIAFNPVLALVKDGPIHSDIGETVAFTFTVRHARESDYSPVRDITVEDDIAGAATYISGDNNSNYQLDAAETWTFGASYTIQDSDPDPLVNTATAQGQDSAGETVIATATHSTALGSMPALALSKDGPMTAYVSETVTFTFTLTNDDVTGDGSPIDNLAVTDDVAGDATYLSGDTNQDGLLQIGETWLFSVSYTIQSTDTNLLVNTATATGTDQEGAPVSAIDTHSTEVKKIQKIETYLVYLPLVARTPAPSAAPDLVVTQITATANNMTVVIKNQGNAAVTAGFWVDLYIDPRPAPTGVNQTWDDGRSNQGMVWGVTGAALPLDPGESLILTTGDMYYWPEYSKVNWPLPVGTPIYVQVDSADVATNYGAILENHEMLGGPYNNISGPVLSTADAIATQGFRMTPHMFVPVRPDDLPTRP
jgi:uncharacterized repeat protein (TIGR01451 family)